MSIVKRSVGSNIAWLTLLLALLLASSSALAAAQIATHSMIRSDGDPATALRIAKLGIPLDNVMREGNLMKFVADEDEIAAMTRAGIPLDVLIADLGAHYAERAAEESHLWQDPSDRTRSFGFGSMGGYYTFDEVLAKLDEMRADYPDLITSRSAIGSTIEGRSVWSVKISDNADLDEGEPAMLFTAVTHAREPQGMATLLYTMFHLLENYGSDPEVTYLLDNRELYFVPVVNADGYVYNESTNPNGGGMWRKNRRYNNGGEYGVDLNRNYGYMWGYDNSGSSGSPGASNYRGTAAFSEPETSAIRAFHQTRTVWNAIHYHSYGSYDIHPHSYDVGIYPPADDLALFELYGGVMTVMNGYELGNSWDTLNYLMNGDVVDWCYGEQSEKNKIYGFLVEVGTYNDGFWPSPSRIVPLAELNRGPNIYYAWIAGSRVMIDGVIAGPEFPRGSWSDVVTVLTNIGLGIEATDATVTITSTDPYVLEIGNPAGFPAIPVLTTGDNAAAPNRVLVAPDAPVGHEIDLHMSVRQGGILLDEAMITVTVGDALTATDQIPAAAGELSLRALPNPFNPRTELIVELPHSGNVRLTIYDASGRLQRQLLDERREAGRLMIPFDGRNDMGKSLPSGLYLARLETETGVAESRLVLLK